MQGRNQFSSRPKIKKTPVHAPRTFPLSLKRAANLSLMQAVHSRALSLYA
jgi:hypothetical protein